MQSEDSTQQNITGRSGPSPNLIDWKPMEGHFPMKRVLHGNRMGGMAALMIGLPWLYFAGELLTNEIVQHGLNPGQALLFLLALGGLSVVLAGVSQLVYREKFHIGDGVVSWSRTGLRGGRHWRERFEGFTGVLRSKAYHRNTGYDKLHGNADYMVYSIFLDHEDAAKRVRLYESHNTLLSPPAEWGKLWRRYSRLFGRPLLEATQDGEVQTSLDDWGRPLLDLMAEGKARAPEMDLLHPRLAAGISLEKQDDLWVVTLKPMRQLRNVAVLLLATPLLILAGMAFRHYGQSAPATLLSWASAGILFLTALPAMVSLAGRLRHSDQIAVDAQRIWYRTWDRRRGDWHTRDIPLADLCGLALEDAPAMHHRGERLVATSEKTTLEFGYDLTPRSRRALRDLLLALFQTQVAGRARKK